MSEIDINDLKEECSAELETTFTYNFFYCGIFDEQLYKKFMGELHTFASLFPENQEKEDYIKLRASILATLEHIIFLFYCHENRGDLYEIKNLSDFQGGFLETVYWDIPIATAKLLKYAANNFVNLTSGDQRIHIKFFWFPDPTLLIVLGTDIPHAFAESTH